MTSFVRQMEILNNCIKHRTKCGQRTLCSSKTYTRQKYAAFEHCYMGASRPVP